MIELKHVERFYPLAKGQFFYVLRDVNLKINEGDFVSIMGPSARASHRCSRARDA
jgi:ABC-type lipoprotein export system ATPase subunit